MADYTKHLNLYEVRPNADGSMTFNIDTMMNDNWDKLDAYAEEVHTQLANKAEIGLNRIVIPAESDLNNYIDAGAYKTLGSVTTASLINGPSNPPKTGVYIDVMKIDATHATQIMYGWTDGVQITRGYNNGDWTPWVYTATISQIYHPNLLINADFRNPVNQRGQTEYTAVGYTIDPWKTAGGENKRRSRR